jgi:peptide chain release factor subunit 1
MQLIPENGLIIFCGEVITRGDKTEFEYHTINPPTPVKSFSYKCNSKFEVENAESLSTNGDLYGLVVLDLQEACWGVLNGSDIHVSGSLDSLVASKHSQGGQSAQRFERLRDVTINNFFVRLADRVNVALLPELKNLKGIMIGGCGMTKDEFVKGQYLHHELRKLIIGTFDTQYTNEYGLTELVRASKDKLSNNEMDRQKKLFDEFLINLAKDTGKAIYGLETILEKLQSGQLKKALISSNRNDLYILISKNATKINMDIEIISSGSDSGSMLDTAFGGMVAISRY